MNACILADKETLTGFQLAGIKKCIEAAESKEELLNQFISLHREKETGIIIISQEISMKLRKEILKVLEEKSLPAVIEIPDKNGVIEGESLIEAITNKAVGSKM